MNNKKAMLLAIVAIKRWQKQIAVDANLGKTFIDAPPNCKQAAAKYDELTEAIEIIRNQG